MPGSQASGSTVQHHSDGASHNSAPNQPDQHPEDPLPHAGEPYAGSNETTAMPSSPDDALVIYVLGIEDDDFDILPKINALMFSVGMFTFILVVAVYMGSIMIFNRENNPPELANQFFKYTALTWFNIVTQWAPISRVYIISRMFNRKRHVLWLNVLGALVVFVLGAWGYCYMVSDSNKDSPDLQYDNYTMVDYLMDSSRIKHHSFIRGWHTGTMPKSTRACEARVALQQESLFTTEIYDTQFARTNYMVTNRSVTFGGIPFGSWAEHPAFDLELSQDIRNNHTLCDQGFLGNTDLYGLGIRCGVYLQWVSSLLANNFLSATRQETQKVYLVFSLAICLATIIASATKSCVFSIEIEILYWMYWGGYVCVFGSAPCSIRLGTVSRWKTLDWTIAIHFTAHWIMAYHGLWFIWHAYDQTFFRMPCGTYHFFLALVLDPSEGYWMLRDYLTMLAAPLSLSLLFAFPLTGILFIPEVKYTLQNSTTYQAFFGRNQTAVQGQTNSTNSDLRHDDASGFGISGNKPSIYQKIYAKIGMCQRTLRFICALPKQRRGGVRLITPVDIMHRRYQRIQWATTGLVACTLSIIAIEMTLKLNRVREVYSVETTGQYIPLIIGTASLISVCWSLIQQEGERRRRIKSQQAAGEAGEEYELQDLASTISYGFAQPDDEFLMSGGAGPDFENHDEADIADVGLPTESPV